MKIRELKKTIDGAGRFLVISHYDPEGDAIGSALAIYFALKSLGKQVDVYNESGVPEQLLFLPGAEVVRDRLDRLDVYDVIFIVDCGDIGRAGAIKDRLEKRKIVNIDHHGTNNGYGRINILDFHASAAGEIVYEVLKKLRITITREIAVNLYTAIMVDTGSFRYGSTSPKSMMFGAELLKCGVDPWEIASNIYEKFPYRRMKLLGDALQSLELINDGKVAVMLVTRDMLKRHGAADELTEGFVNFGRAVEGVEVSILFKEIDNDFYKLSFRSKGSVNVAEISQRLGGGGHRNAAGCRVSGSYEQVKEKVINAVNRYFHERHTSH